jgi:integrase/recombinase XerD
LVRRDYAASTIRSYIQIVEAFRQHTGARLDRLTPAQLRRYHLYLLEGRRLAVGTVVTQICALRFFCRYVLKRRDVREDLPYPKQRLRLPVVLSPDEVQRLIAGAKNLYHRTLLLTLYGAGLRRVSSKSATSIASAWCSASSRARAVAIGRFPCLGGQLKTGH